MASFRMDTYEKVKEYLEKQKKPIYKTKVAKDLGINNNTLNLILEKLNPEIDNKGRLKLC